MRERDNLLVSLLGAGLIWTAAAATGGSASEAPDNETINYSYDALGRMNGSSISGGPNNSRTTGTCFDRAGNRVRYDVATSAPVPCPTPSP